MIIITLIASLILRLISLNQSLWLDEATTALVSKMTLVDIFTKFMPGDFHPPLYYLVLKGWTTLFGYSEISLRIPSIIFGIGAVYLIYLIGKKLFDKNTGLIAGALLATSGLSIYYSQEARMYAMTAFLVALAFYLFLKKKWVVFSVILLLIGMTDYVALFVVPVFLIAGWKDWKKTLLSLIPLIAGFVLWLPIFLKQITAVSSVQSSGWWGILGTLTFKNIVLIPVKFMLGRIGFDDKNIYLLIVVVAGFLFASLVTKSFKSTKTLWLWLTLPIIIGIILSFKVPSLIYFRFLFCLTPFYLLIANGVSQYKKSKIALIVILLMFNLATSGYYLLTPKFQREDWRGLVSFIKSKSTENDITIFSSHSNMEAYLYYAPDAKIAGPEGIVRGYDQIWLMSYLSDIFDAGGTVKLNVEALGYENTASYTFRGIGTVHYYENRN